MEFGTLAFLIAFIALMTVKVVSFIKFVSNADWKGAVTQLLVWVVGIVCVWLFANSAWGSIQISGVSLSTFNAASIIISGIALGSAGSFGYDAIKPGEPRLASKAPSN